MDQWTEMASRWAEWGAPLRPTSEDVMSFRKAIRSNRNLLLGATPELQQLAVAAVDSNIEAIRAHGAHGTVGDWRRLPFRSGTFDGVIGDGSLNVFEGAPPSTLFDEAKRVGNQLILRVFVAPEIPESLGTVIDEKDKTNFHAFKWRVAMSLANPFVAVKDIYAVIKPVLGHPTLEVYKNSDAVYFFPKLSQLPTWTSIQYSSSYQLAERCPVITWTF